MNLNLITGTPGAGKTLFCINTIQKEHPDKAIYYSHIEDLTLEWSYLDDPTKWNELPNNTVFVCDEAHLYFPLRDWKLDKPKYLTDFAELRHKGIVVYLITQNAKDLHTFIRNRITKHYYVKRPISNSESATVFIWSEYQEYFKDYRNQEKADTINYSYNKDLYGCYKSADIHTVKKQLPHSVKRYLAYAVIGVLAFALSINHLINRFTTNEHPPSAEIDSLTTQDVHLIAQNTVESYLNKWTPRLEGIPSSAPAYDGLNEPETLPRLNCISNTRKCQCYTQQATRVQVPESICRDIVENGYFDYTIGG